MSKQLWLSCTVTLNLIFPLQFSGYASMAVFHYTVPPEVARATWEFASFQVINGERQRKKIVNCKLPVFPLCCVLQSGRPFLPPPPRRRPPPPRLPPRLLPRQLLRPGILHAHGEVGRDQGRVRVPGTCERVFFAKGSNFSPALLSSVPAAAAIVVVVVVLLLQRPP